MDVDALLQLLPACKRCRAIRKRCDTLLPACANCTKSGAQCTFYDSVSKELLPREYIQSMIEHVRSLEASRGTNSTEPPPTSRPVLVPVNGSYEYLGQNAPIITALDYNLTRRRHETPFNTSPRCPPISSSALVDEQMHQFLVGRYLETIHELYPVFSDEGLPSLLSFRDPHDPSAHFLLRMVYSIACHCLPANDTRLLHLSDALYRESLAQIESLMKDHRLEALQAVILLAIRSTFDATTGSIGQLVTFAHRLEIELSSYQPETPMMHRLQGTIYCLIKLVTNALDRPYEIADPNPTTLAATTDKARSLCSIYAWQAQEDPSDQPPALDPFAVESPMVLATLRQTQLLVQPRVEAAQQLLAAYDDDQMIYNVFASHWIYRAGSYLIAHADGECVTESCVIAARMLERCASKWPNARVLQGALENLRRRRGEQA